jgi:ArsR family transcriptional regulator, lead/cadmium/zinc/bismuth-responsive transcriptional repressor
MLTSARPPRQALVSPDPCDASHLGASGTADRKRALMADSAVRDVARTFGILGDPTRVRILDALSGGELCVCDIACLVGISESAVSHQLRLLRDSRLVTSRRVGRHIHYALDDRHILDLLRLAQTHVQEPA